MSRRGGDSAEAVVHPDPVDDRDRWFSELDLDEDDTGDKAERADTGDEAAGAGDRKQRRPARRRLDKRARKMWRRARKRVERAGELPASKICDGYRELADVTWHQRGQECTGFALSAIADYHIRRHWLRRIERELDKRDGSKRRARTDLTVDHWNLLPLDLRDEITVSRRMMYEMAQKYDRQTWRSGSTTRGALKGWMHSGVTTAAQWPYDADDEEGARHGRLGLKRVIDSVRRPGAQYYRVDRRDVDDMRLALAADFPLFVRARLHSGWYEPYLPARDRRTPDGDEAAKRNDTKIRILDDFKLLGGHAFVIVGYDHEGWLIHNSWGPDWGDGGYAVLPYEDWAIHGSDVWFVLPPAIRDRYPVDEDRFLPTSTVAAADGELARTERRLDDLRTRLAIHRARAAVDGTGETQPAGDGGDGEGGDHDDHDEGDGEREPTEADLEAAVAQAGEAVDGMRREIEASVERRRLGSTMWRHVIVMDDDGGLLAPSHQYGLNRTALFTLLWMFRRQTEGWDKRRLAIIADGGYWSHDVAVEQLQPLRDELMDQEIYPIFLLWDTPWYAAMVGWLYGNSKIRPPAGGDLPLDSTSVEPYRRWYYSRPWQYANAAEFPAPRMWRQMKRRAVDSSRRDDGAASILADAVAYNRTKAAFEVHLVGHGVGDLLLPGLAAKLPPVASCNLWAPATTREEFHRTYAPMTESGHIGTLGVHVLEHDHERSDHTGPVPGSVLRLVSDVLEVEGLNLDELYGQLDTTDLVWPVRSVPLLGLHDDVDDDPVAQRLRSSGRMSVDVVGRGRHLDLLADDRVHSRTIARIRTDPPGRDAVGDTVGDTPRSHHLGPAACFPTPLAGS